MVTGAEAMLDALQDYYQALWEGRPCASCKLRDECEAPLDGG